VAMSIEGLEFINGDYLGSFIYFIGTMECRGLLEFNLFINESFSVTVIGDILEIFREIGITELFKI
jgi:hypothetical protein